MYKKILVAVDLTPSCSQTLEKACQIAEENNATCDMVHVVEQMSSYGYAAILDLDTMRMDEAKKMMAELGQKASVDPDRQHVMMGNTKYEVLALAEELGCDLIVVGRHSRHGLSRLLGSTANAILQGAHCDVMTIHLE